MFNKVFKKIKEYLYLFLTTIFYILLLVIAIIGGTIFFVVIGVIYLIYLFFKVISDSLSDLFD